MTTQSPFAGDDVKADVWEQGFLAGHAEPETDHVRPFSPDLLDVYQRGELAGRDERRRLPPAAGGVDAEGTFTEIGLAEAATELGLHTLGHFFLHSLFRAAGGLIATVALVIEAPTDSPMRELDPDFEGPVDQPEEKYVALCPRTDHPLVLEGATPDGYWAGKVHDSYADATADLVAHGHPETVIARCSLTDNTCGAVWPGPG